MHHKRTMPISLPCTTKECQEAALAAMRAEQEMLSPTGVLPTAQGNMKDSAFSSALEAAAGGSGTSAVASPPSTPARAAASGGGNGGGGVASPSGTPASGGVPSSTAAPGGGAAEADGGSCPSSRVRFSDEEGNLSPLSDSRASSVDSLQAKYDAAAASGQAPPGASGFHVKHTAGGRLEAVSSGARWEEVVGYSRAVKRGPFIFVSGTSAVDQATGRVMHRRDAYKQTRLAFTIIERALAQVGATLDDVVRTRMFVRHLCRDGEGISRAHGEVLGHVRPASTMVEVSRLVHEDILVVVEADALLLDK